MATYVALVEFTPQGMNAIRESPARAEAFTARAERMGVSVKSIYWTTGAYDGILIVEAPDEPTAAALFLWLAQHGNVKTQTLRAYERAEFELLLEGL